MKVDLQTGRKVRIEMLPLIDIVFLLLVFFIYAMLSMAVHRGLPVILPKATTVKPDQHLTLSVTVKSDGTVYLDNEQIPLETLAQDLKRRAKTEQETGILLFADRSVPYQALFQVLDQISIAGLSRISLQAELQEHP